MDTIKLSVLIADDHAILRSGLKRLLSEMPEIDAVGEADNGDRVIQMVRDKHWDVVLLDLDMPGLDSLDVLRRVKMEHPDIAVLILSMYPEAQFAMRALKAGAAGYLNKTSASEQLITAIREVAKGGAYISSQLAATLANSFNAKPMDTLNDLLTDREFAVLRGIVTGKSLVDIGHDLKLSAKTITTYRTRLLSKLKAHSNVDLVRYAEKIGLIK